MSDALAEYRAARSATEALASERLFDLRVRWAKTDALLFAARQELARCRIGAGNERRATVPHDDLVEALRYLQNHLTQLELAERGVLNGVGGDAAR